MQLEPHDDDCNCPLCILCELDSTTDWEQYGDVLAANDPEEEDDRDASVAVLPIVSTGEDDGGEGLDYPPKVEDIIDCIDGMRANGLIADLIAIVNLKDDTQTLLTTFARNDLVMGCLSIASLNWHQTQIDAERYLPEDLEGGEYE